MSDPNPRKSLRKSSRKSVPHGVKFGNVNPYVNFIVESLRLPEYKTMNKTLAFKTLGQKWSRLTQQERQPYINIANETKKKGINKRDPKSRLAISKKINNRRSTPINEPLMPVKTKKSSKNCYKCGQKHGSGSCRRKVWKVGRRRMAPSASRNSETDTSKTSMPSESDSCTTMTATTNTRTTLFNSETSMSTF